MLCGHFAFKVYICKKCPYYDVIAIDMIDVQSSKSKNMDMTYWAHKPGVWKEVIKNVNNGVVTPTDPASSTPK